jgi:hypothetical protein
LKSSAKLEQSLVALLVVRLEQAMVWIETCQKIGLYSRFAAFNSAYVVSMIVTWTKPMSIVSEGLGTVVNTATRAAYCYTINYNDVDLFFIMNES